MFTSFIGWLKGLSVAAKVGLAVAGAGTVGVVAVQETPAPQTDPPVTITTDTMVETQPIAFSKQSVETDTLNKGVTAITTNGVEGTKTLTYTITRTNGVQTKKTLEKEEVTTAPVDEVTSVGTYVAPPPAPAPRNNCDPNYSPCVPQVSYDLDCPDIGFGVRVLGSDPHRFDREGDGYGCESY